MSKVLAAYFPAAESGLRPVFFVEEPDVSGREGLVYIASFRIE